MRPTPTRTGAAVALALALALLLAACTSSSSAAQDVSITACTANPSGGHPVAKGTVDNHSSKASTYAISVGFYDSSGNRVSVGAATLGKVESGATATFTADGLASATGPLTCKLASAARTVAP